MIASMQKRDLSTFREALVEHMQHAGDDVTTLAARAGVSRDALYKVIYNKTKTPRLELVLGVASAYGESVEEFMGLTPVQIRDDLLEEIARLSPSERKILQASLAALRSAAPDVAAETGAGEVPDDSKDD